MNNKKKPIQAIEVNKEWHSNIEKDIKNITIREGDRGYCKGRVILFCTQSSWCVEREIVNVESMKLSDVSDEIAILDGFKSSEDLYFKLKEYYPSINKGSIVTIVNWK